MAKSGDQNFERKALTADECLPVTSAFDTDQTEQSLKRTS